MSEELKHVSPDAIIEFPTGTIKASTLELMLNKLPFELGYCNEDNIFTWFSAKPDRLRPRRVKTLGEKVFDLHPHIAPKVRVLLDRFEKGEEQNWILHFPNKEGKAGRGYKKFIAVRDIETNEYLGSMDATVDLAIFEDKAGKHTPETIKRYEKAEEVPEVEIRQTQVEGPAADYKSDEVIIDFETGKIKASTLDTIIRLCPFEMGFCDAEDNFRWYSNNPTRVHHRRTSAFGHSVLKLHPKVAHHVRVMLDDFKSGTKDEWAFWFPKRSGEAGQMYQKFMAVRDPETNEYLGCMDITVNIDQFFDEEGMEAMKEGAVPGGRPLDGSGAPYVAYPNGEKMPARHSRRHGEAGHPGGHPGADLHVEEMNP
ncbi:PAS domain-containing protein [Lactococcus termiticola]|uniref:Hemerythrin HHE cation binding domain protein n=1 Tax=Lactococcus termiticola TaxID=2169526 RepID=A0A2R5HIS5_9LACT|nr:PAS domain-containing protein [Lactococcus termiticola]GBG96288.1 hemerythrin HHE cation binding domain protein [Lactococcus termiticola]